MPKKQTIEATIRNRRLAEESAKLDPRVERALAEEGLRMDSDGGSPAPGLGTRNGMGSSP